MQYGKIIIQEAQTVQYAEIALFYTDKWWRLLSHFKWFFFKSDVFYGSVYDIS